MIVGYRVTGNDKISDSIREYHNGKIKFTFEDTKETVEFYVLEQTRINGSTYILVTDSEEDDAECLILKESGAEEGQEIVYDIVEDDTELLAVSKVFEELLEDVDIEL